MARVKSDSVVNLYLVTRDRLYAFSNIRSLRGLSSPSTVRVNEALFLSPLVYKYKDRMGNREKHKLHFSGFMAKQF